MTTIEIKRTFQMKLAGELTQLPDPNPNLTPQEVCDFFATQYPELTNATIVNKGLIEDSIVYEFQTVLGTKG